MNRTKLPPLIKRIYFLNKTLKLTGDSVNEMTKLNSNYPKIMQEATAVFAKAVHQPLGRALSICRGKCKGFDIVINHFLKEIKERFELLIHLNVRYHTLKDLSRKTEEKNKALDDSDFFMFLIIINPNLLDLLREHERSILKTLANTGKCPKTIEFPKNSVIELLEQFLTSIYLSKNEGKIVLYDPSIVDIEECKCEDNEGIKYKCETRDQEEVEVFAVSKNCDLINTKKNQKDRPEKRKIGVSWDSTVVDNEGKTQRKRRKKEVR